VEESSLQTLLEAVACGQVPVQDATMEIVSRGYVDLGFARIDHNREYRTGIGEMIYCAGKTPEQAREIARVLLSRSSGPVLATRATEAHVRAIHQVAPTAAWHPEASLLVVRGTPGPSLPFTVLVMTAGTSDIPVAEEAAVTLEALGCSAERQYDVGAAGIHRVSASQQALRAADLIIVCAGMDGVLPTLVAGLVGGPLIAVPTSVGYGAGGGGIAPLLTMLNACAPGVAVVNIDNGFGAATLAVLILRRWQRLARGARRREGAGTGSASSNGHRQQADDVVSTAS
jgi:NCAIR mutase (PurE)-related protein